jgi:hypothetical protein
MAAGGKSMKRSSSSGNMSVLQGPQTCLLAQTDGRPPKTCPELRRHRTRRANAASRFARTTAVRTRKQRKPLSQPGLNIAWHSRLPTSFLLSMYSFTKFPLGATTRRIVQRYDGLDRNRRQPSQ